MLSLKSIRKEDAAMSRHFNLLRAIFQDPMSAYIHWREIESLLYHLGVTIEPTHGVRFRVVLNGIEVILHHPHHSNEFTKQDIKLLREYLTNAGVTPAQYAAERVQGHDEGVWCLCFFKGAYGLYLALLSVNGAFATFNYFKNPIMSGKFWLQRGNFNFTLNDLLGGAIIDAKKLA
jgi:hypothetical protein